MNQTSVCKTMMAAFVLDAVPVNVIFQSASSNDIVVEHPGLESGVRFRIMDNRICNELRVISITTGTSVMWYNLKSFLYFKASLKLSFNR